MEAPIERCLVCFEDFVPKHGEKTCSLYCRGRRAIQLQKRNRERNKKVYPLRKCDGCGEEFRPLSKVNKYCNVECRKKQYMRQIAENWSKGRKQGRINYAFVQDPHLAKKGKVKYFFDRVNRGTL